MKFRTVYENDYVDPGTDCKDPSLTVQAEAEACDINHIVGRIDRGLMTEYSSLHGAKFGDFSSIDDYQSALNKVIEAQHQFGLLPAKVRARFGNDPAHFIQFVSDPANVDEMIRMGIAVERDLSDSRPASSKDIKNLEKALKSNPSVNQGSSKKSPEPAVGEGPNS